MKAWEIIGEKKGLVNVRKKFKLKHHCMKRVGLETHVTVQHGLSLESTFFL